MKKSEIFIILIIKKIVQILIYFIFNNERIQEKRGNKLEVITHYYSYYRGLSAA